MKTFTFYLLVFLHNLVMVFFVILNMFAGSPENQVLISAIGIAYWIAGWMLLYRKKPA